MKLRMSEVYLSVQGEGPRVGWPTVFVRFAGCNLRCPGWPCDTQHAIDPAKYRKEWKLLDVEEVADWIDEVAQKERHTSICFTGGEPFLQNNEALGELTYILNDRGYTQLECFSNGTLLYPKWATDYVYFTMDWKLTGSGEDPLNENRLMNLKRFGSDDSVKFVIKDRADFDEATRLWYETDSFHLTHAPRTYAGVVWGELESSELVSWILEEKLPWWLNIQTHNFVWPPNERAR